MSSRDSPGPRGTRMMRKAEALGLETRNVSSAYLLPVLASKPSAASHSALGAYHEASNLSPKAASALRTTRMLQSLGQKVIFSNDPYVNSAFESLLTTRVSGLPADLAPDLAELIARKPPAGRLRPKGSKAAALRRAKRLVGAGASFRPEEVPFVDALRVCDLERDRSALPALLRSYVFHKPRVAVAALEEYCDAMGGLRPAPMLQAAALLMQAGYFFAAIKVVYGHFEALHATLSEMESLVLQHMDSGDWDTAAALWHWKDPDRELFLKQFNELKIIAYYLDVRKQLRSLKEAGVVALARVEREMLLKVIQDFKAQLQEDYLVHLEQQEREAEERARAKARLDEQARAAAEAAARRADEASKVEARSRAAAEAKAKRDVEMREKAREMERKRDEVRRRAAQAKKGGRGGKGGAAGSAEGGSEGTGEEAEAAAGEGVADAEGVAEAEAALVVAEAEAAAAEAAAKEAEVAATEAAAAATAAEAEAAAAAVTAEAAAAEAAAAGAGAAAGGAAAAEAAPGEAGPAPAEGSAQPAEGEAGAAAAAAEGTPEAADPALADEAADKVGELPPPAGSRTGSRVGSRPGSSKAAAAIAAAAAADAAAAAAAEPAAAAAAPPAAGPSGRPAVRVHLRPGSRGLKMNLSMDGGGGGPEAEELRKGIAELRAAMAVERAKAEAAAAALKAVAVGGSRPSTATPAIRLNINLTSNTSDEQLRAMEQALDAERAEFQRKLEEERATLASVLADEKGKLEGHMAAQKKMFDEERQRLLRDLYEQQGRDIEQQLVASVQSIDVLKQQRDALRSAGGAGSRHSSGRNAAAAEEAARLEGAVKMLEKKLDDELSHVKQLEEEKTRVEGERTALEASQRMLEAQKSQAELEKAKAEQEKGALQEQIAKTMRMFQEQLAQTVKMAAMLQAQRILGAAAGGVAPALSMGPMGPVATPMSMLGTPMGGMGMGMMPMGTPMGGNPMAGLMGTPMGTLGASGGSMTMQAAPGLMAGSGLLSGGSMSFAQAGMGLGLGGPLSASNSAGGSMSMLPAPVAALPGEVDDPPTQDEIVAYGKYLGMDVVEDSDLLHIAEWALTAPLPEGWTVHLDGEGNEFFYNAATNDSTYEHPMDEHYRAYYRKMKEQKQLAKMTEAQQAEAAAK